ncbi:MAG: HAD hydrolase family protein [Prolixibacteraceae bacterium]|nr:HAD hydrolase family protein [Prolixibacteraceae bacterium]
MDKIKLIATDLDGTFLNDDKSISGDNLRALVELGNKCVKRVAATGRNLRKVMEVIPDAVPFDYIIFSSGAGVIDWKQRNLMLKENLSKSSSVEVTCFLVQKKVNFNAFWAVPNNHYLWFHRGGEHCEEFERYFTFHNSFASPLPLNEGYEKELCQFLVILPDDPQRFFQLKEEIVTVFPETAVIRSTSPLGTGFIWMEIFNRNVSKGNALSFICKELGITQEETVGIGNDFNDMEMLDFTGHSFIVANAPNELQKKYHPAPSNRESAFAFVAEKFL